MVILVQYVDETTKLRVGSIKRAILEKILLPKIACQKRICFYSFKGIVNKELSLNGQNITV